MLFRPTQKLATKIKVGNRIEKPLEQVALVDWSANLFVTNRKQFILLSNTQSLYSCIVPAAGIVNESKFVDTAMQSIEDFMREDGLINVFKKFVLRSIPTVQFAKALNRSVTGSMNDHIFAAKLYLGEQLDLNEVGRRLNKTPMSALRDKEGRKYNSPDRAIKLVAECTS